METTTTLGDWYANVLHLGRRQLVLCTSDRTLLSVVFPAQQVREQFGENLRQSLARLLRTIGISEKAIVEEMEHMQEYVVTGTESRSVLGSMNDFKIQVEYRLRAMEDESYDTLSLGLSEVPCSPLKYQDPAERTRELFHRKM